MSDRSNNMDICSIQCGSRCCKSTPPALTNEDFIRINKIIKNDRWYTIIESRQKNVKIVSKKNGTKDCFFLLDNGLCEIYDFRPLDCKLFPLFLKIKKQNDNEYNVKWLVWYCPLTEKKGIDKLRDDSTKLLKSILSDNSKQIFEYQEAMYISRGYKKKHFFKEECLKIGGVI